MNGEHFLVLEARRHCRQPAFHFLSSWLSSSTGSDDEVSSVDADSGVVKPTGRSDFARAVVAIVLGLGIARLAEVLDEFELKPAIQTLYSNIPKFVWNIGCC